MKNILSIFCILIICLNINSICAAHAKEKDEIIPLAVGNEWTYAVYSNTGNDTIFQIKIVGDTLVNGEKWYTLDNDDKVNVFYKNDKKGLIQIENINNTTDLLLKYPTKVNEEYKIKIATVKVVSVDNEIEVLAGKFKCFSYYVSVDEEIEGIIHVSPGIGIIKILNKSQNKKNEMLDYIELKSYKLK